MRTIPRNLTCCVIVLTIALSLIVSPSLFAQEADDHIVCSSDVIVMLYIAERYFDFGTVHDMVMQNDSDVLDLARYDRGQFASSFTSMMNTMEEMRDEMTDMAMEEARINDLADMTMMSDEEFSVMTLENMVDMEMSDMTTILTPATLEDESEECSALRNELNRFFQAVMYHDLSMDMTDMVEPDATATKASDMEATPTETVEATATEIMEATPTETVEPTATEAMEATATETVEPTSTQTSTGTGAGQDDSAMTVSYTAPMSGPQAATGPGDSDATGTAIITINETSNEICWDISVMNAKLPATAAHIHLGAIGVSGDVVVGLSAPDENGDASGCTTAEADVVAAILQNPGNYYVNIHTTDFPDGALRGQLT